MRKVVKKAAVLAIVIGMFLGTSGISAKSMDFSIPELVVMKPGDPDQVREFYLDDAFDLMGGGPAKPVIFIGTGDNETKCGKLSITLETKAKRDFGAFIKIGLQGIAYGIGSTEPVIINAGAVTPSKAVKDITFNTIYGMAIVGALIRSIEEGDEKGQVELPAPFTITFKLAVKEKNK